MLRHFTFCSNQGCWSASETRQWLDQVAEVPSEVAAMMEDEDRDFDELKHVFRCQEFRARYNVVGGPLHGKIMKIYHREALHVLHIYALCISESSSEDF